ncbi:hypothetical protein F5I97DRAFT_818029 [Phlebopus sp. FC_14]|nr:hypothetical protein F5I97DRAFT_818029 [Phlebopus sp. FC_14]
MIFGFNVSEDELCGLGEWAYANLPLESQRQYSHDPALENHHLRRHFFIFNGPRFLKSHVRLAVAVYTQVWPVDSDGHVDKTRECFIFGIWTDRSQPEESPLYDQVKILEDRLRCPPQWWLECESSDPVSQADQRVSSDGEGNSTHSPENVSQYTILPPPACGHGQIFGFRLSQMEVRKFASQLAKRYFSEKQRHDWKHEGANTDEDKISLLNATIIIRWIYQISTCYVSHTESNPQEGADEDGYTRVLTIHADDLPDKDAPPPERVQAMADFLGCQPRWWVEYDPEKNRRARSKRKRRVGPA